MSTITVRGLVISKYRTIGKFSQAIGWQRQKASRILNGIQEPNVSEIQQMAICLDIDTQEIFLEVFFPSLSEKWTKRKK